MELSLAGVDELMNAHGILSVPDHNSDTSSARSFDVVQPAARVACKRIVIAPSARAGYCIVDGIAMPSFPPIGPSMITMGVDTGATHCFAGRDWIAATAEAFFLHGYAPRWHSKVPGHLSQADGGKAGTIGVLSIPYNYAV